MGEAGKPQRRAGRKVLGAVASGGKGGRPEDPGTRGTVRRGWRRGDAEGGPSGGEEKREFKLLTLLVFLNNLCNFKHLCINFLISHPGAGWPLTSQRPSVQWAGGEDQFLRVLSLFYDMIKCF